MKKDGRIAASRPSYHAGASVSPHDGPLTEDQVEAAYRRYFPMIVQKSRRILRDASEAQDLAQETFLRLWKGRLDLRDVLATTAWLYKTCTRLALDRLRSRVRPADGSDELAVAMACPQPSAEDRSHHRGLLRDLLDALPAAEVEAAVLARVDGLNQQEIAEVLGTSERTVRRLLARADDRIAGWRARREGIA
jgi:RNA polymerase sigma-70 factor (ECF subfamily)